MGTSGPGATTPGCSARFGVQAPIRFTTVFIRSKPPCVGMLGKVFALSSVLAVADYLTLMTLCPSQSSSCVYTGSYEASSALFWSLLVIAVGSGIGYAVTWPKRLRAIPRSTELLLPPVSFDCPNCGAPNQAGAGVMTLKCPYCGASNLVPRPTH
jgi:DNA-directed RNA polymerase subunit RPC12/RpoP